jgi:hypothetical protein
MSRSTPPTTIQAFIEGKFLSVCPTGEAVAWLKEKREAVKEWHALALQDHTYQEEALVARDDPYIDFCLARYGTSAKAGQHVYARGDAAIRYTFLAHFPNGGFGIIGQHFELSNDAPSTVGELSALVTNPSLSDELFRQCFEQTKVFAHLNEDQFQSVVATMAGNPRLMTPYDDSFLDGWSDYSYRAVFSAAWNLANTVPPTPRWASVLYHLLVWSKNWNGEEPAVHGASQAHRGA